MKKLLALFLAIIIIAVPAWSKEHGAILFYESPFAFVDNQTVFMPAPVTVINGQAMIPLDFMANLTGSKVSYDNGYIWIQHNKPDVYFNEFAEKPLLDLINSAKSSIDIQMYSFTYENVIEALKKAIDKPDIQIKILLRDTPQNRQYSLPLVQLKSSKLQVMFKNNPKKYLHRKLAIFDKTTVWIGSTNWSDAGFNDNSEVDISLDDPELAREILTQMDKDWTQAKEAPSPKP